jgi:glyoxylase-like metal-dependent hydrolase (beta-lactamase superfamily II)
MCCRRSEADPDDHAQVDLQGLSSSVVSMPTLSLLAIGVHSVRRFFLAIKSTTVALIAVATLSCAHAQTLPSKDAPGWYRMRLGQFEITALWDGTLELPVDKIFTKVDPRRIRSLLSRSYLSNEVTLTVNAFLENTGAKLVLIDTGTGTSQMFGSKLGNVLSNFRASGYAPEQVDEIYVTHMHTDHVGGLMRDGKPSFANATVRADAQEGDFYLSQSKMDAAPADEREDFESAMKIFEPYIATKKYKPFVGEAELIPGAGPFQSS